MDGIETLARLKALGLYADAWGEEYDADDAGSRACMEQLVKEISERIKKERSE
ncbi:MAG: hypothetical protein H0U64_02235 [Gemmatimonadaceae bacterium]|nr:hypothetical protein [Gemmatimonadaceae bacterium]